MNDVPALRTLHHHRLWVNRNLRDVVADLSDEQLDREFELGQGSIRRTVNHMIAAEYVWLEAIEGNETPLFPGDLRNQLPGNQLDIASAFQFPSALRYWTDLDQRWISFLDQLPHQRLDHQVAKQSTSSGKGQTFQTRLDEVLLHVCTHAQYTTAQLMNMLRHCGVSPLPDVMLITMVRGTSSSTE